MRRFASIALGLALLGGLPPAMAAARPAPSLAMGVSEVRFDGTRLRDVIETLREGSGANFNVNWKALASANVDPNTPVTIRARNITLRKALDLVLSNVSGGDALSFYAADGVIEITTRELADKVLVTRVYDITDLLVILPSLDAGSDGFGGTNNGTASSGNASGNNRSGAASGGRSGGGSGNANNRSSSSSQSRGGGNRSTSTTGNDDTRQQRGEQLASIITQLIEPEIWKENGGSSSIRYWSNGKLIITAPRRIHERIGGVIE